MKFITMLIGVGVLGLCGTPVLAHHSANMFDPQKEIVLDGSIKEFQWSNPHIWIQVNVPNQSGGVDEWSVEAGSPNLVGRQGWKRNSFKAGDKVVMKVHPLRNGQPGGSFISASFADGHSIGNGTGGAATAPAQY